MKRVFSLLVLVLFLNGCDDGDLTLETINFENATTKSCSINNIIYKLKENEALLLEIDKSVFENEPTIIDTPKVINIDNSAVRVIYNFYNGSVGDENICNTIPPATPIINDQWVATFGKIEITTTSTSTPGAILGSTVINGYKHRIVFKNIVFDKKNGTPQVYDTFDFGDLVTTITPLAFGFDKNLRQCPITKDIYQYKSGESFSLENIDSNLIVNEETPLNSPRTALIGTTKNKLSYRLYNGLLTPAYFCNAAVPPTPVAIEAWVGDSGLAAGSGIIEVTTIRNGTTAFKHTIIIKDATLRSGNKSFKLGNVYNYGEFLTP